MKSFSDFSDEIRKKITKSYDEKEIIVGVLKNFLKIKIDRDLITFRDTVLTVKVSGAKKQEIFLKAKEIQRILQAAGLKITEIK